MSDLERFDIDPDQPGAGDMVEIARYLEEQGVSIEGIRAARDLEQLTLMIWRLMFGLDGEQMTVADAASAAGLTEEQVRRFIRTLGLPTGVDLVLTVDDVEVLRLLSDFSNLIGEEQVAQLTRVIGASLGRMAEATSDIIRVNVEGPQRSTLSPSDYLRLSEAITKEGLPRLTYAMDRIFRYHILRVSAEQWELDAGGTATTTNAVIGFADMVGFTAHSGTLSTSDLTEVIDRFESLVSETISSVGGRVVKFIGDEVMFTFADVSSACGCARDLLHLAAEASIPDVRVGLAYGEVITRYGDCYGPVVNRAARLVDVAPPRAIFVTPEIGEQAGDAFDFEAREAVAVKGIDEPVQHLRLR